MQSHRYDFKSRDLLATLGGSVLPLAIFALVMHTGARIKTWPNPRPALDTERTVLLHQADAARRPDRIDVALFGDSSCLMNVSARALGERLGRPTLNLATFSFLDLNAHTLMLREFLRHQPGPPRAVVLLMHPEALRRLDSEPYYLAALTHYWGGTDHVPGGTFGADLSGWLGVEICRGRFVGRWLPTPLAGAYGRRYGFAWDLEAFMDQQRGSAVDPEPQPFSGSTEYRLSPTLEKASRNFRIAIPAGTRLLVGLTPVPARFAGRSHPAKAGELLRVWGTWLRADALLTNLPPTLPDQAFVRTTHLRENQIPAYTEALAQSLAPQLR